jgi:hypothetical protein
MLQLVDGGLDEVKPAAWTVRWFFGREWECENRESQEDERGALHQHLPEGTAE